MPIEPAAIRRYPAVASAFELGDAENKTNASQDPTEDGRPDDDLCPQRSIAAQLREIEPMRDGPKPIPEPLGRRRPKHDLTRRARDIDVGALGIVEDKMEKRPVALTGIADRPLIAIDDFRKNRLRVMTDNPLGRIDHNGAGFALAQF